MYKWTYKECDTQKREKRTNGQKDIYLFILKYIEKGQMDKLTEGHRQKRKKERKKYKKERNRKKERRKEIK